MKVLSEVKEFLRIDFDDDDSLINTLIISAKTYIFNATGKEFDQFNELHKLCLMILITHWYENREAVGKAEKLSFSLSSILTQIEYKADETV